jgi:CheY-like chemotaxis protein
VARDSREQNPQRVAPLRLLVAEDSIDSFTLFQVYVKAEGHHISRAMNGAEAVEMVKSEEYDLVIMDIDMPVMGGYMAFRLFASGRR